MDNALLTVDGGRLMVGRLPPLPMSTIHCPLSTAHSLFRSVHPGKERGHADARHRERASTTASGLPTSSTPLEKPGRPVGL